MFSNILLYIAFEKMYTLQRHVCGSVFLRKIIFRNIFQRDSVWVTLPEEKDVPVVQYAKSRFFARY